jgi:hypothetical protein
MTRPILLPALLGGVMLSVFFLPKVGKIAESAVRMSLPKTLGEWELEIGQASKKEVDTLDKETQFSKAVCLAPIPYSYQANGTRNLKRIDLSIVLSGTDINNSIHRPERCMPSQGHQIYDAKSDLLTTAAGKTFPVRNLTSLQVLPLDPKGEKTAKLNCVTLYFFIGQKEITESHLRRTFIDMRDRLLRGQDQRWAYVSASMWFSEAGEHGLPSRENAEKEIRQFLSDLADNNIDWTQIASKSPSL